MAWPGRLASLALAFLLSPVALAQTEPANDWFPYIGLWLDSHLTVADTYPDSPSQKGGLAPGDHVLSINGVPTAGVEHSRVVAMLRGDLGSQVVLTVLRSSKPYSVTLTRAPLAVPKPPPKAVPDDLDGRLVRVTGKTTADTPGCLNHVVQALSYLPRQLKRQFLEAGVVIALQPVGGAWFEPGTHRVVVSQHSTQGAAIDPRLPITTLHELGHAYDQMLRYYSGSPEFLKAYSREAPAVPAADRDILSHFLQPSPHGQRECFASLFACKYYPGRDFRLDRLRADFPNTLRVVQALNDK